MRREFPAADLHLRRGFDTNPYPVAIDPHDRQHDRIPYLNALAFFPRQHQHNESSVILAFEAVSLLRAVRNDVPVSVSSSSAPSNRSRQNRRHRSRSRASGPVLTQLLSV